MTVQCVVHYCCVVWQSSAVSGFHYIVRAVKDGEKKEGKFIKQSV